MIMVGDEEVLVNLVVDLFNVIGDKINIVVFSGVIVQIVFSDDGGLICYQFEIEGTSNLIDGSGVFVIFGVFNIDGKIDDEIISGVESDKFNSMMIVVGSLLGLVIGFFGMVQIGGVSVDIDLVLDLLVDIQIKFDVVGIGGVTILLISGSDDDGNVEFQLCIDGLIDLVDDGNVFESLGLLVGSNNVFESVVQVFIVNVTNQQIGVFVNFMGNGVKIDEGSSDMDILDGLVGLFVFGIIRVGDKVIVIDLVIDFFNDVCDKINDVVFIGVMVSVNVIGLLIYELEICGTIDFDDDNDILQIFGVLQVLLMMMAVISFVDIFGGGVVVGDIILIVGINYDGVQVSGMFIISNISLIVQNFFDMVEQIFGDVVIVLVDGFGRIVVVDNETGESLLVLSLQFNNEGDSSLNLGMLIEMMQGIEVGFI